MGRYINTNSKGETLGEKKVDDLVKDGAEILTEPIEFQENLVCVIHNPRGFDAAGYMYSEKEFNYFNETDQEKTWLRYPHAKELAK